MSKVQTMPLEIWTDINGNATRTQFTGGVKYIRADERDRLTKEYVRLFRLGEPIAKMLSELSILPIGCSREQELAWKMAVKNFRHYQRDYAADVLLRAALTPAGGGQERANDSHIG